MVILAEPQSRDPRQWLGRHGEALAERALRRAGLRILERRFRCRGGEIDLIAEDGRTLVFAEVKTRSGVAFGLPAEAVTAAKQRRIVRAARLYLSRRGLWERPCRFDVITFDRHGGLLPWRLRHYRNAFQPNLGRQF